MNRKQFFKVYFFPIVFILIFSIYSVFWFTIQHNIEKLKNFLTIENQSWKISYQKADLEGFPFKFRINIKDLKVVYNNKLLKLRIETHLDHISAETGPLLNQIVFTLPRKIIFDSYYQNKYNKWSVESKKESFFKVKEAGLINTFKIIDVIRNPDMFNEQSYSLEQIEYQYYDCHFYNLNINKELFSSDAYSKITFKNKTDSIYKLFVVADNKISFIDHDYLGYNFDKASYNLNLSLKMKKVNNEFSQVPLVNVHQAKLTLDNSKIILNGSIKHSNLSDFKINFDINIIKLNDLLEKLVKQKSISSAKKDYIINIIKKITGENELEALSFKAYTTKDSVIRVGEVSGEEIINFMSQLRSID